MASDYCTRVQLRRYLDLESDATGDDALIDGLITRASRAIDRHTRRRFYEFSETREYDYPDDYFRLYFDADLLDLTTLTIDGTASTNYKLSPKNYYPKHWLDMTYGSGDILQWSDTPQEAITIAWHIADGGRRRALRRAADYQDRKRTVPHHGLGHLRRGADHNARSQRHDGSGA
jgi:hypothetical protein